MTGALETSYLDPQTSTGLMLWRVTNSWQRTIRAALAPFDLTHVQFVLLAVLTSIDRSAPVTQRDLAAKAVTDPMMTSQVLRALENKGLIERLAHPTDGRARTLAPTAAGVTLVNRANAAVEHADRAYFAALGEDAPRFTRCLAVLDTESAEQV
ncbi:MAG: MarR family winged helix-turn-helix transcriptional regulator [Arachnia sp.]